MTGQSTLPSFHLPAQTGRRATAAAMLAAAVLTLTACAGQQSHRRGMDLFATGQYEAGLAQLAQASQEAPDNQVYRMAYLNARQRIVRQLLADATRAQAAGQLDMAQELLQRATGIDADAAAVREGQAALAQARRHAHLLVEARQQIEAGQPDAARQKLALLLRESPGHEEAKTLQRTLDEQAGRAALVSPLLAASFRTPVRLEFRDAGLKLALEALSHYGGLNFVVDKEVPENLLVTVFLRDVPLADALDVILTTSQLRWRALNDNTLLIYPDTAAKQGEHQELMVKNVFLRNAEAKQVAAMLKTVLKMRTVHSDDRLNLLIMRDTPAMIQLADRMVATQDVEEPEVMLEVAIVEVTRSSLQNLGIQFPNQLTLTPLPATGTTLTLDDLRNLNSSRLGASISPLVFNLQNDAGVTNLLANPSIRTRNREKAMIRIGDRVPVITTTATSTGFLSENVQYVDVGLKLEVEPTIYPGDEVVIKLALEVSSVVKEIVSKAGSVSYQLGGRNAATVLRLKNGETQILGGLINDEDRRTANRFPGLSLLPIIGRLFASESDNNQKTELVLSITPRVIRSLAPPPGVPGEFWSGTENDPRLRATQPPSPGPALKLEPALELSPVPAQPASPGPVPSPGAGPVPEAMLVPEAMPAPGAQNPPMAPDAAPAPPPPVAPQTRLRWHGPDTVRRGDTFQLALAVDSNEGIGDFPLRIRFDKTVFEVLDAAPGPFMAQGSAPTRVSRRVENGYGLVMLDQARQPPSAPLATGTGDLAALTLRALKPTPESRIRVLPSDPLGRDARPLAATAPAAASIKVQP